MPPKIKYIFVYSNGLQRLVACSLFDEEGGQGTENECLNGAAEPVKVQAGDGGDTDGQPGIINTQVGEDGQNAQDAGNDADHKQSLLADFLSDKEENDTNNCHGDCNIQGRTQQVEQGIVGSYQSSIDQMKSRIYFLILLLRNLVIWR